MVKAKAQRASLEQILEVAFSRRICCSRACRVRTNPLLPFLSVVIPTIRPGIRRTNLSRQAKKPRYGPP